MKRAKSIGVPIVVLGLLIMFLNPLANITGFAIAEQVSVSLGYFGYALGLILFLIGASLRNWEELDDIPLFQKMWAGKPPKQQVRESSIGNNSIKDSHARYVYTQIFKETHNGRKPTDAELHELMAQDHHRPGRISEVIDAFDARRYHYNEED